MSELLSHVADAYFYVATPSRWPRLARRVFVLTLPLSGPLFLLWWLALPVGGAVALSLWMAVLGLAWVAYPLVLLGQVVLNLWSRP